MRSSCATRVLRCSRCMAWELGSLDPTPGRHRCCTPGQVALRGRPRALCAVSSPVIKGARPGLAEGCSIVTHFRCLSVFEFRGAPAHMLDRRPPSRGTGFSKNVSSAFVQSLRWGGPHLRHRAATTSCSLGESRLGSP